MKESFTIDELKEFFESNVVNSARHGQSYYETLDGVRHSTDVGYFEECMPYFLQDLQHHLDEINKPEVERNKAISSYKNPIEALNHLHEHLNTSIIQSLTVCKFSDDGKGVLYDYFGSIGVLNENTGTNLNNTKSLDWADNESYYAHYDQEHNALMFFVDISGKLSND